MLARALLLGWLLLSCPAEADAKKKGRVIASDLGVEVECVDCARLQGDERVVGLDQLAQVSCLATCARSMCSP